MKNLLEESGRIDVLARLDTLRADSTPRWGKLDVGRMLCHLTESMRLAAGDLKAKSKGMRAFQHFPLKHLILYVFPFPKGAPTAPELLARATTAFETDRGALRPLVEGFAKRCTGGAEHPLFGVMDAREWGALAWKHADHHLRQFGV